jgi:hypothetical protein
VYELEMSKTSKLLVISQEWPLLQTYGLQVIKKGYMTATALIRHDNGEDWGRFLPSPNPNP